MKIIYYCSGLNPEAKNIDDFSNRLINDIKERNSIVFILASNDEDSLKKDIEIKIPGYLEYFKNIGIEFKEFNVISFKTTKKDAIKMIKDSSVILLKGGNPFIQLELIKNKNLVEEIKNYNKVIIGFSAGAMIMGKNIIITPCGKEYPNFDIKKGLQLSNISIIPHINVKNRIPNKIMSPDGIIYKKDIKKVSINTELFYLLQDKPTFSFIRVKDLNIEFLGGTIWKVENNKIYML